MSDNSSSTNSWTFLTSEVKESGVENVGVSQGGTSRSGSGPLQTEQLGPELTQGPHLPDNHADETLNLEPPQVTHLDSGEDAACGTAADLKADPVPSSDLPVESLSTLTSDPGEPGCSVDHSEGDHPAPDSELLSDTIAPTSSSPGSAPDPDTTPQHVEELSLKDERSELRRTVREEESKPNFETSEEKVNDCAGMRRRNLSLLTPQHHRDEDEEDDVDEHIRPFPREDGFGFSLNKCIFGALVLLGLGTVFFSAGESDVGELKDPVLQKEWFNSDAHAAVQPSEILQRLAKGSEQIAKLQAQLQQQEEQLKAVQVQVEEGFKERTRREELEVENQQMKAELDRLPALQKQLEQETQRMKRESAEKDLQSLPAMQEALEFLRSQMAELSQNAASLVPSLEHEVAANQGGKGPEHKKQQGKGLEEKRRNEWKKDGRGKKEVEKPRTERDGEKADGKRKGDREKGKAHQEEDKKLRGKAERKDGKDDGNGKRRKDGGEKRRFSQDGGKGDEGDDAKWKKEKRGQLDGGREELKEKWKHGREWKKVEQAGVNEQKQWKEQKEGKKDWNEGKEQEGDKERGGDRKDKLKSKGKCDKAQKEKMGKGENNNNHKGNGEKVWSGQERGWLKHEGSAAWKEEMKSKDEHHQARQKYSGKDKPRRSSSDKVSHYSHSNRRYSKDHTHDDYWTKRRDRMRHHHGSTEVCTDVTACAHAEGLVPVHQSDFEALLLSYLTRLLGPEEQMSKKEDLNKLIQEFFTDGLFIHDQMPFGEFVEDVADILEDLAEDEGDEQMEDEMEGFVMDAMEKFAFPDRKRHEDKRKGVSG